MTSTPRALGYRMPAEWEPHAATWLSWPHNLETWPGRFEPIPGVFAEIVRCLCSNEAVQINVNDGAMEDAVRKLLLDCGIPRDCFHLHRIPTNDAWCRDHGPTFLVAEDGPGKRIAAVDWRFNSWGGKYPPFDLDDQAAAKIAAEAGVPVFSPGIVMEGGSFDVNGRGSLLTSESCLLNPNRNPGLTRLEIENYLKEYLGVTNILWLGEGIEGDDTDGHVDDTARFVSPDTIVTVVENDPADANYRPLEDNLHRLHRMQDQDGLPWKIVPIPMPPPGYYEGRRLPRSYANFYIANSSVLVPSYDPETDRVAFDILQSLFPGRKVVGIESTDLVWGLGAIHCVTQQQPAI